MKLCSSPFLYSTLVAFSLFEGTGADGQLCTKQTVYKDSAKCDGKDSQTVFLPVSDNPYDSCRKSSKWVICFY